jgi:amidohydrolase
MMLYMQSFAQDNPKTKKIIERHTERSFELCKYLHQHPELSEKEFETARRMADELEQAGMDVYPGFAGNSVVGILKNGDGPVVMLRTDMDALPVKERTGLAFASTRVVNNEMGEEIPVMHACGHDIHMSVWVGTLHALVELKDTWKGTLLVIAQQAEERGNRGADLAIDKGLYRKFPVPDYALAYHINPELESGTIGLAEGPVFAGIRTVNTTVYGEGGHGAYPEKCIDPIVIASRIVLDLQTIVSREISTFDPAVITVGAIHGGSRANIIPDEVTMKLTLRYYSQPVADKMIHAIQRICKGAAAMAGLPENKMPRVEVREESTLPVINESLLTRKIKQIASDILGEEKIIQTDPVMAGEDFGKYGRTPEKVPICMIWLGSTAPEEMQRLKTEGKNPYPLHSPFMKPDYKKTLHTGIKAMVASVIGLMNHAENTPSKEE